MKSKLFSLLTAAFFLLSLCAACSPSDAGKKAEGRSGRPDASSSGLSEPGETVAFEPRITFPTQEYEGSNIAEIPYIEYEGETDAEIESLNRMVHQGIGRIYDDFKANPDGEGWIEIKAYPVTSDRYLQAVVTYITYPSYGADGRLFSINYDKTTRKAVTLDEATGALSLDQASLEERVAALFVPETEGQRIADAAARGFLLSEGPEGPVTELLLEVTVESDAADPWKYFYSFTPASGELLKLNGSCLFDPSEPDQTDPPLSYARGRTADNPRR